MPITTSHIPKNVIKNGSGKEGYVDLIKSETGLTPAIFNAPNQIYTIAKDILRRKIPCPSMKLINLSSKAEYFLFTTYFFQQALL